ncbi:MAG: DivIVA domain-containing protein [Actinomycetes bacterium]
MPGGDVRRLAVSSSPKLTPDEIASRSFGRAVRGVSEQEVRSFLTRVAEEVGALNDREDALRERNRALEAELANPPAPTEQQLLAALGEETARVLRSAQEAAEDIRTRAEDRAAVVLREAEETARSTRETAETEARERTEAAEATAAAIESAATDASGSLREAAETHAAQVREDAERDAARVREDARIESESVVESARQTGRDMLAEAKAVRERVLADLARRRELLTAQIEELRGGRDRLLGAYRVVKQTLSDATQALGQVEARGAAVLATPAPASAAPDIDDELAAAVAVAVEPEPVMEPEPVPAVEAPEVGAPAAEVPAPTPDPAEPRGRRRRLRETFGIRDEDSVRVEESVTVIAVDGPDAAAVVVVEETTTEGPAVSDIFARLRADAEAPTPEPAPDAEASGDDAGPTATVDGPMAEEPAPAPLEETDSEPADADAAVRAECEVVLTPLRRDAVKRAKRALQDDQNAVLDRLRTVKGRPDPTAIVGDDADRAEAWAAVMASPIAAAYVGAHTTHTTEPAPDAPASLVADAVAAIAVPLRDRLVVAVELHDTDGEDAARRAIGAAYREAKGAPLEDAVADALAAAWARGVHDAVAEGTLLRWVPSEVGRCADCDDNALEATRRGDAFPTGQPHPPAHPGCRCMLTPAHA